MVIDLIQIDNSLLDEEQGWFVDYDEKGFEHVGTVVNLRVATILLMEKGDYERAFGLLEECIMFQIDKVFGTYSKESTYLIYSKDFSIRYNPNNYIRL